MIGLENIPIVELLTLYFNASYAVGIVSHATGMEMSVEEFKEHEQEICVNPLGLSCWTSNIGGVGLAV
jgi:hypothetical protein